LKDTSPTTLGSKIRTQTLDSIDLELTKKYKWGEVGLVLANDVQKDTDEYYSFKRNVAYLELKKEF